MKRETEYGLCKFVATKDEIGYQEVLDDFEHAQFIYVLTFNISPKDETLLDKLNEADLDTDIKFFTNIPSRFETYYASWAKNKASNAIENYLEKLNFDNFNSKFEASFIFENHSKIIMTNNIAYIGSANFSKESSKNFEAGMITQDKNMINSIKAIIDEETPDMSIPYYKADIIPIILLARDLEIFITQISEDIWGIWEIHGDTIEDVYMGAEMQFDVKSIEIFEELKEEILDAIGNLIDELSDSDDDYETVNIIDNLEELKEEFEEYTIDDEVIELVEYDEQRYIDHEISENALYINEDTLDDIVTSISQKAWEIKEELASDAQDSLYNFKLTLSEFLKRLLDIISDLKQAVSSEIDNTK